MEKVIDINTGEMAVGNNNAVIRTVGIGSCVVTVLYDKENKVGAMAHSLLPTRNREDVFLPDSDSKFKKKAKYVDEAIDLMLAEIEKLGGKKDNIKAKLVGGSRMFKILSGDKEGVGFKNIESATQKLLLLGIPVESEATGGTVGRMAEFNLSNGVLNVETKI